MKRILSVLFVVVFIFLFSGCTKDTVEVTVVLKNATEYELEAVTFMIPPTRGSYSPAYDLVTAEGKALMPGEEREISVWLYESDFGNDGWPVILIKEDETQYGEGNQVTLRGGTNRFEIICDDDKNFMVTAVES